MSSHLRSGANVLRFAANLHFVAFRLVSDLYVRDAGCVRGGTFGRARLQSCPARAGLRPAHFFAVAPLGRLEARPCSDPMETRGVQATAFRRERPIPSPINASSFVELRSVSWHAEATLWQVAARKTGLHPVVAYGPEPPYPASSKGVGSNAIDPVPANSPHQPSQCVTRVVERRGA